MLTRIILLINIIFADLVPLRQRGYYIAILMAVYGVDMTIGSLIRGAIVDSISWRWVSQMTDMPKYSLSTPQQSRSNYSTHSFVHLGLLQNRPIGGLEIVMLFFLLSVKYSDKKRTLGEKMKQIDWIDNSLLMTGTIIMLYALIYARGKITLGILADAGTSTPGCYPRPHFWNLRGPWVPRGSSHATAAVPPPHVSCCRGQYFSLLDAYLLGHVLLAPCLPNNIPLLSRARSCFRAAHVPGLYTRTALAAVALSRCGKFQATAHRRPGRFHY
jgi:MFS family permease